MADEFTLSPAYGRDYRTRSDVVTNWEDGKDFKIVSPKMIMGQHCSIKDMQPGDRITIRYSELMEVCVYTMPKEVD